ncbi:hypothetical protein [Actinospica sp.]|jgi:hypothetical protein|uniref:hypothetical protein n=1 Tax=Actinospica sp. TaxID=1872142 RepID=UPI002CBDAAE9|nr:hypothetical protein [Actinospica sp.]HWG25553.1 hypothetical protein [Actinospica sp.]
MKTFSTDGRVPLGVVLADDGEPAPAPSSPDPADIETADKDEALAAYAQCRTVTLPGREPLDLEAISDLWLD